MKSKMFAAFFLFGINAVFALDPSCVDPVNFKVNTNSAGGVICQQDPVDPNHPYWWSIQYQCGNGVTQTYSGKTTGQCPSLTVAKSFIPNVKLDVVARAVDQYSGVTLGDGFEAWNTESQAATAKTKFGKYKSVNFQVTEIYPTLKSALPFDGQVDSADYVGFSATRAYANKCRAALRVTYAGSSVVNGKTYSANVYVFPGKGDVDLFNKPLVVGDAFDPANGRDAWGIFSKRQYRNLLSLGTDPSLDPMNTYATPRAKGYDVWFIDFGQGGGDIHINAGIELRVIEWLTAHNSGKVVVGGPSMSGLVARTALLYSLPANNVGPNGVGLDLAGNVAGLLTIDTPHQGASISGHLQRDVYLASINSNVNNVVWVASLVSDTENDAKGSWKELNVPAAHEMLYEHYYADAGIFSTGHQAFYSDIESMGGLRKDKTNVAIAYSNFHIPHQGTSLPTAWRHVGDMNIKASSNATLLSQVLYARSYEFYPGSTGNWYVQLWKQNWAKYMDMFTFHNNEIGKAEIFAGTFIPINSSLGLDASLDVFSNPSLSIAQAHSMFDKIYFMDRKKSDYLTYNSDAGFVSGYLSDSHRFEHIVFDPELMGKIVSGLDFIQGRQNGRKIIPAITLLLN